VQCEVTGRRDYGRIEPLWFWIRIDYSQLYSVVAAKPLDLRSNRAHALT